jgi:PadR family transcriptional regulator PadR
MLVEGTPYPLLTRFKNIELLSCRWEESQSGPQRKYYSITKIRKVFLEELTSICNYEVICNQQAEVLI